MKAPTTLPDALAEIEELRGQVRDLLRVLKQEPEHGTAATVRPKADPGGIADAPEKATAAQDFSKKPDGRQQKEPVSQILRDLQQVIGAIPDVIFKLDLEGNLTGWNKRLETVTGFTSQELNGRSALSFVPEHEHAQTAAAIQRAFEDGYAELEGHMLTKAQLTIPYHWTGAALKNEEGRVIGITGVGRDVSEKRRIQAELKRQRQQLLSAQALAHVGSWEWDITSGDMEWSEEQFRIFGHEPGTIPTTYEALLTAVLPDDHDRVTTGISTALKGQEPLDIECRIVRPSGEIRNIHCRGEIIVSRAGHPTRVSGSTLDITDRKQAELALQRSEAHFRALIEHSSDIITVLDLDGTIRFESPSLERLLGFAQHEIDGLIAFDFIHPDDLPTVLEKFQLVVQRPGEAQTAEFRFRHKDGSWLPLEGIGRAILDKEGRRCVIVNSRDVTERKRVEDALIQRSLQQQVVAEFGHFVLRKCDLQTVLDKAVQRIAQTLGTEYCKVLELQPGGTALLLRAGAGWHEGLVGRATVSADPESQAGFTLSANEPVIVEDLGTESRFSGPPLLFDHGVVSGLSVIIQREHQPWGVLGVHTSARRSFTQHDVNFVQSMANILGSLIERSAVEETLAHRERELRTMLDALPIGIWFTDQQGQVLYGNPVGQQIWSGAVKVGLLDQSVGTCHWENIEATNLPHRWTIGSVLAKDQPVLNEMIEIEAVNGRRRTIRNSAVRVRNDTGALQGAIVLNEDITERKQAEADLLESEERFRTLVGNIPGAVYRCAADSEWTMSYLSHTIEDIVGYPAAEFIGNHTRSYASVIHPDDRPKVEEATLASLREHRPYALEYRLVHENGAVRWVYEKGRGVFDPDGEVRFLDGAIFDITDRVAADQAIRQQHGLLTAIMNASIDHISVKDLNGRYIHMNRTGANALGMPINEIIGLDDVALWGSESAASLRAGDRRVVESGETITTEDSLTGEGKASVFLTTKAPYRDPEGRTIGVISVAHDITEHKQAEETLRQSETRFRSLFEHSPIAYQSLDQEGRFIDVNQRLCQLLGYDREELIGREFGDLWTDERQSDFPLTFASFMQTGKVRNELALRHRDGTIVNVVIDGRIQRDKGGKFVRTHCILTDITERKKVEDALRRSEARLNEAQRLAHIGSWELDLMRNRLVWSDEIFRIFEIDQHQFDTSYEAFLSLVHPDDRSAVDRAYTNSVRDRTPYEIEHRLLMPDGRIKYVHERCETTYDAKGLPVASFGTVQDVTERVQLSQRELARSEQLQRLSELGLTLSGDPAEIFDRVVRVLGELLKVRVVCLSEIIGEDLYFKAIYWNGQVVRDAGHCPLNVTPCATVQQDKAVRLFDCVMEQFPQATFLRDHQAVAYCGFPALDAQGRVVAVTCLLDDKPREFTAEEQALLRVFGQRIAIEIERARYLADQRRQAEALQRSHAFLRQVIDTTPNFVFAKDRPGRFTLANKAIATAYGTTVDHLIGKTDADFNRNPDEVSCSRLNDLEVIDTRRERFIPEERITDAAGNVRWLQTVKRPLLNESGEAVMVLGAATDITDRKRIEEALRQRERDLQQAIEDRQRISEDLHDGILQSIYAIGLGLEACKPLVANLPNKSAVKLNAALQRTIGQLNHVLEEVRNFIAGLESQILDGQDFEAVLRTMVHTLAAHYPIPYRIAIEQTAAQNLSTEQAYHVMNIAREALSNSLRHSGATRITVSLKRLRRTVRLSVTDNGAGFNPVGARDVGHGLANMAARTQKLGGKLTLQSKPRQGAKVLVDIPRRSTDADT